MIERHSLLSLSFYEKSPFTGSYKDMCYKIEKIEDKDAGIKNLKASIWKGPFSSEHTPDESKQFRTVDFGNDGMDELVSWMNEMFNNGQY